MSERKADVTCATRETEVRVVLNLDGSGRDIVQTGLPLLDRMLALFARRSYFDLEVQCKASEGSACTVEETAGCLGLAFHKALGDRKNILRTGHAYAPVDESLARAVVDISGHPRLVYFVTAPAPAPGCLGCGEIERFWKAFVSQAHVNLHIELTYGHETAAAGEAIFKAAAKALNDACRIVARRQ